MYKYWGFGLKISSEIEFLEFVEFDFIEPDIEFKIGLTPNFEAQTSFNTSNFKYKISDNECLFEAINIAKYYTNSGKLLIIEPLEKTEDLRVVKMKALGTPIASLLLQRNRFPLHASAFLKNDEAILLMGNSGAGKSTMFSKLTERGYAEFSDDAVVINSFEENNLKVCASYPMIRLWSDTIEKLDKFKLTQKELQKDEKYGYYFHSKFNTKHVNIKSIIVLNKVDDSKITSQKLSGVQAFKRISEHIFRPMLIQNVELRMLSFKIITQLTNSIHVFEVQRPDNCDVNLLADHIEELLDLI